MPKKRSKVSLKTQLERAERKGRTKGMADLLALLSAADDGFIPDYSDWDYDCNEYSWKARLDAAMMNAASQNNIELVQILCKAGANVNAYNEEHRTALQVAVEEGHTKLAQALLKAGASVDPEDYYFDYGYDNQYVSPLQCVVDNGDIEIVKILLAGGALNKRGRNDGSQGWPIDYAAEGDQVEITQAFLEAGAYLGPYYCQCEGDRRTPLMLALCNGKLKAAALLVKAGCDIDNDDNNDKETALMQAVEGYDNDAFNIDAIRFLLNSGADVNYRNDSTFPALILAAVGAGHFEAVRLLLSAGADVFHWVNWAGRTRNAFDVARNDAIKEILKSEMHRRIAAALSVLPTAMPAEVRQKIIQLYAHTENET